MKKTFRVYQVDAFTREKFTGNPAGVVPDAVGLSERQMQSMARELNNSETAFLFPGKPGEYDVHIRFFTPTNEVPICGHATVASHFVRAMLLGMENGRVVQKCGAGLIPVEVEKTDEGHRVTMFQGPTTISEPLAPEYRARLLAALGVTEEDLREDCPVTAASTGAAKVMVGLKEESELHALKPDMEALKTLSGEIGFRGYHVFTIHPGQEPLVHARMFGPANGNNEDPVTGVANGPLGGYLVHFGLIPAEGDQVSFVAAQGEAMGRPGTMEVRVDIENGTHGGVSIVGDAVVAFQTEIELECEG